MKNKKDTSASPERAKAGAAAADTARVVLYAVAAISTFFYAAAAFISMSDDRSLALTVYSRLTGRDRWDIMREMFESGGEDFQLFDFSRLTGMYLAVIGVAAAICVLLYVVSFRAKLKAADAEKL